MYLKINLWKKAFEKFKAIWSVLTDYITSNFFKGCNPQSLLGPFLNTFYHISRIRESNITGQAY